MIVVVTRFVLLLSGCGRKGWFLGRAALGEPANSFCTCDYEGSKEAKRFSRRPTRHTTTKAFTHPFFSKAQVHVSKKEFHGSCVHPV